MQEIPFILIIQVYSNSLRNAKFVVAFGRTIDAHKSGRAHESSGHCDLAQVDRSGPAATASSEISRLAAELPDLWLRRSRPGLGLQDSVARLQHTARVLSSPSVQQDPLTATQTAQAPEGVAKAKVSWWSFLLAWLTGAERSHDGGSSAGDLRGLPNEL